MKGLRDLSLRNRIYRLSGTVIFFFLLVIGWLLFELRENLYEARRHKIRSVVDSAWHVLEFHAQQADSGALSPEEARRRALQVIAGDRFDGGNYFWLGDPKGAMIMHPLSPELEGQDLTHYLDPSGKALFREMLEVVKKEGEGFVQYEWPRPDDVEPEPKISFVKVFPAWGWMVGAGYYVGDIDREVIRISVLAGTVLTAVILGALLLVRYVAQSISIPMASAVTMIEALEKGFLGHRLRLDQKDEVGRLARAMDAFADNLQYEILTAFEHLARGDFSFEAKGLIQAPLARTNTRLNALVSRLDSTVAEAVEARTRTEALIAAMGEGVAIFNRESKFVYQNSIHEKFAGQQTGKPCFAAYDHSDHFCPDCAVKKASTDGRIHRAERRIRSGEGDIHLEVTASPVRDANGAIVSIIEIARDVTARKQAEAHVNHLAFHDTLTGLPNRALMEDRLNQSLAHALRSNEKGALFFIDLDRFKVINDSLGHHVGDLLLKQVGNRLKTMLREADTVCRPGGDEFILLFPGIGGSTDAAHLAEKILTAFTVPFIVEGREIVISTSIGISLYPADGEDFSTLSRNADAAMYLAKDKGRNNFQFFKPELTNAAQEGLTLENELRKALTGNELQLHYQPQFDTAAGEIIGVEALVRWHHPRRGWISPAQFIPIAEQSGLIETLGAWVLKTACAQNKLWQQSGYSPIRMAVNVSGRQFRQTNFVEIVDRVLEETGLDPHWLELEVTENIVMENVSETIMTLTDLKARNISLAIDDFGTGYSSLSYLRQFPIDRLKIDRSFVAEVTSNADDAAIATAVIGLARTLNLEVVAEGVETAEQALFLTERQCDIMQGYYFGRPSPPEDISRLLERRRLVSIG